MKISRQTLSLAAVAAVTILGAIAAHPASARPLVLHTPSIQAHHHKMMMHRRHKMMMRRHIMMHHKMMHKM